MSPQRLLRQSAVRKLNILFWLEPLIGSGCALDGVC